MGVTCGDSSSNKGTVNITPPLSLLRPERVHPLFIMIENRSDTFSARIWPLWLPLLSIPLASCAAQGTSPILAGDTRLAGGSGGLGIAAWDDTGLNHDVGMEFTLEGGTMISDQFEFGVEAAMGFGIGETDSGGESFSFALDPGIYGRYYFSELGTGTTPWISADIIAVNAVHTGIYDNSLDTVFVGEISAGLSTFLADNLALEFELFLGGYLTDGTDEEWVDLTDIEAFLFSMGPSFYY